MLATARSHKNYSYEKKDRTKKKLPEVMWEWGQFRQGNMCLFFLFFSSTGSFICPFRLAVGKVYHRPIVSGINIFEREM
jgi:hypothetical protein